MSSLRQFLFGRGAALRLIDRLAGRQDDRAAAGGDGVLRLLFDDAPFGALLVDRDGRVLRANAMLRQMAGDEVELGRGALAELVFAAEAREAAWSELAPILNGRQPQPRDFTSRLEGAPAGGDGGAEGMVVSVCASPLREADDTVSGALLRISDITLQKRLEAQLAQSQKLQAVGQLAGGIAHDFNNLLTAVLGAADSIESREDLDSEVLEDAAQIRSSAERGAALVRQLLAFGRQQTLQPRGLLINDVITDLSGLLRRLLGGKVRLELELETPGRMVFADLTQLDQVLVNLAVNARDAMPDGGVLTLRSGHSTIYQPLTRGPETIPPGRYVEIEVRDTGVGIMPEVLPRIFDPFFTTKRDRGGSGLGLSTVHGIVRQSDGFLTLESEVGSGTSVHIYLPRWDGPEAVAIPRAPRMAQPAAPAVVETAPVRLVLLVEDEEPVRRLAERTLARRGWTVLPADSGEAALALLEGPVAGLPAPTPAGLLAPAPTALLAIVTDMVMPGMDGASLVRAVRELLGAPELPAILVSGYAEETLRRDLDTTATVFLPKPYSLKALADTLEEVTKQQE
jgi:two-component system cell cycle sensor histidine kinase/response regulator CckA